MGCAPIAHVLFSKIMKYNPENPKWVSDMRCNVSFCRKYPQ
jgi:transketolase